MCLNVRGRTRIQRMRSIYYIGCWEPYRIVCIVEGREEKRKPVRASVYRDSRTYIWTTACTHTEHRLSVSKSVYTRVSGLVKRPPVVEYMHIQDLLCSWRYGFRPVCVTRCTTPEILGDSRWRTAGHPTCYPLERPLHQPPLLSPHPLPELPTPFRLVASGTLPDNVLSTRVPSSPIADSWLVRRNCVCSSWSVNRIHDLSANDHGYSSVWLRWCFD